MRMRGSPGDKSKLRRTLQVVRKRPGVAPPTDLPDIDIETSLTPDEADVWDVVDRCNTAWLDGRPEDVAGSFAEDAVAVAPDLAQIEGRDAIVASFAEYDAAATTKDFEVIERSVSVMKDVAVVTYLFEVSYEQSGETHLERAQEVLVLARSETEPWRIRWRTQVPLPAP